MWRYIDIRDKFNIWRVAEIKYYNEQDDYMNVHFDGWAKKWDEVSPPHPHHERRGSRNAFLDDSSLAANAYRAV